MNCEYYKIFSWIICNFYLILTDFKYNCDFGNMKSFVGFFIIADTEKFRNEPDMFHLAKWVCSCNVL